MNEKTSEYSPKSRGRSNEGDEENTNELATDPPRRAADAICTLGQGLQVAGRRARLAAGTGHRDLEEQRQDCHNRCRTALEYWHVERTVADLVYQ